MRMQNRFVGMLLLGSAMGLSAGDLSGQTLLIPAGSNAVRDEWIEPGVLHSHCRTTKGRSFWTVKSRR